MVVRRRAGRLALAAWALRNARGRPRRLRGRARTPRPPAWRASGRRASCFGVFVVMGALHGLAALLNVVRFIEVPGNAGTGLELKVIAAVVVGGTAVSGGRGTLAGTLAGVALLGTIGPALTFLGISPYWEKAIQGAIILLAVAADASRARAGLVGRTRRRRSHANAAACRGRATAPRRESVLAVAARGRGRRLRAGAARTSSPSGTRSRSCASSVEIGLLALALTPVIVTGGIDLSVGVADGARRGRASAALARRRAAAAARRSAVRARRRRRRRRAERAAHRPARLPPLIVTLGTFSLFRGLAEGLTGGVDNFTGFPAAFLFLGQGYLGGACRRSCSCSSRSSRSRLGACCTARRSAGRCARSASRRRARGTPACRWRGGSRARLHAVGARRPASRRSSTSRTSARRRPTPAPATSCCAITAVVLGGTSIFGGRGTIRGTLLGLFAHRRPAERPAARRPAGGARRRLDRRRCCSSRSASTAAGAPRRPRVATRRHNHETEALE